MARIKRNASVARALLDIIFPAVVERGGDLRVAACLRNVAPFQSLKDDGELLFRTSLD